MPGRRASRSSPRKTPTLSGSAGHPGAGRARPSREARSVPLEPKPGTYRCESYTFTLQELPRADGKAIQVGSLSLNDIPVAGGNYHRLELPVGSFIWYPQAEDAQSIGWTRINP